MRHKYDTQGIVIARSSLGEASAYVSLLTPGLGLVRARAQSVRKPGAKLAHALATYAESEVVLVRGKEGWRVSGAVLTENWFKKLKEREPRLVAARVVGLLLRLVAGEAHNAELYPVMYGFFNALTTASNELLESIELLTVLRILSSLGLDAGDIPGNPAEYSVQMLTNVAENRTDFVNRINQGITASGL